MGVENLRICRSRNSVRLVEKIHQLDKKSWFLGIFHEKSISYDVVPKVPVRKLDGHNVLKDECLEIISQNHDSIVNVSINCCSGSSNSSGNWNSWYLSNLQQRSKMYSTRPNLQVGDLVILKYERFPPVRWRLAQMVEGHRGYDGLFI
ncbi:unnamed protein product [Allacma fusca]|uniref:DUF5641 domain-containing protein n=1 Tax=Allacma fusca TaxID=39272 RepID=A0A8J2P438_9HEXA|nr:unnamed protein product [Allacma fusca]